VKGGQGAYVNIYNIICSNAQIDRKTIYQYLSVTEEEFVSYPPLGLLCTIIQNIIYRYNMESYGII